VCSIARAAAVARGALQVYEHAVEKARGRLVHVRRAAAAGVLALAATLAAPHVTVSAAQSDGAVPILMYHVIATPFATSPFPGLYVSPAEFAAQMHALAAAGYEAVTLDHVRSAWLGHAALPAHPIVITFDNGYRTQFTEALPILRRLDWVGVENLQLSGLPRSEGGLTAREVSSLVAAGWELDTQGYSHVDLNDLGPSQLRHEIGAARVALRRRYGVPVNWFCYPSGDYDLAVVEAVQAAGFVGSTTVVPGWARPSDVPYVLPRLRVLGGTTPRELLGQIAAARFDPPATDEYRG
jgi:peptidoglycan/xylan/chitin deacetylase (PgdA/CDA1 family)